MRSPSGEICGSAAYSSWKTSIRLNLVSSTSSAETAPTTASISNDRGEEHVFHLVSPDDRSATASEYSRAPMAAAAAAARYCNAPPTRRRLSRLAEGATRSIVRHTHPTATETPTAEQCNKWHPVRGHLRRPSTERGIGACGGVPGSALCRHPAPVRVTSAQCRTWLPRGAPRGQLSGSVCRPPAPNQRGRHPPCQPPNDYADLATLGRQTSQKAGVGRIQRQRQRQRIAGGRGRVRRRLYSPNLAISAA